jgi:hypothetical protein
MARAMNGLFMLICRCGLRDSGRSKTRRDSIVGKIRRHLFRAASISPEHKWFGLNYDLPVFEKLQMVSGELP